MQIKRDKPIPVHVENVPDVFFQESATPIFEEFEDNYLAEYSSFLCYNRDVKIKFRICSRGEVVVHVNNRKVCLAIQSSFSILLRLQNLL